VDKDGKEHIKMVTSLYLHRQVVHINTRFREKGEPGELCKPCIVNLQYSVFHCDMTVCEWNM
jgi:hypothetical protein